MTLPRFFVGDPLVPGSRSPLPEAVAHHAVRVRRLAVGDDIVLFNGLGGEYTARLAALDKKGAAADVLAWHDLERESPLDITLIQAVSSGERMDYTIEKAVELGVRRIVPVLSERVTVRLDAARAAQKIIHWQRRVVASCEQCGRNRVPEVLPVMTLGDWLARPFPESSPGAGSSPPGARLVLAPTVTAERLRALPVPAGPIAVLVGPEGGYTETELRLTVQAGYRAVSLGPRILRTETAAPAFLAAVQVLWGDL